MFREYTNYDGLGLAELIRTKEVSPQEVLEAAILQAESVNPTLNAIVTPLYDEAHRRVREDEVDGPLANVGAKDIKPVQSGHGVAVLSTPTGIMTSKEAKKKNVGGEVMFEIW